MSPPPLFFLILMFSVALGYGVYVLQSSGENSFGNYAKHWGPGIEPKLIR